MARKTCDLTCWPGCVDRPDIVGCHTYVSRVMPRDERRYWEIEAANETIKILICMSQGEGKEPARIRKVLRDVGIVA